METKKLNSKTIAPIEDARKNSNVPNCRRTTKLSEFEFQKFKTSKKQNVNFQIRNTRGAGPHSENTIFQIRIYAPYFFLIQQARDGRSTQWYENKKKVPYKNLYWRHSLILLAKYSWRRPQSKRGKRHFTNKKNKTLFLQNICVLHCFNVRLSILLHFDVFRVIYLNNLCTLRWYLMFLCRSCGSFVLIEEHRWINLECSGIAPLYMRVCAFL